MYKHLVLFVSSVLKADRFCEYTVSKHLANETLLIQWWRYPIKKTSRRSWVKGLRGCWGLCVPAALHHSNYTHSLSSSLWIKGSSHLRPSQNLQNLHLHFKIRCLRTSELDLSTASKQVISLDNKGRCCSNSGAHVFSRTPKRSLKWRYLCW